MSAYHGPQHKGAARERRATKRHEAELRAKRAQARRVVEEHVEREGEE